MRKMRKRHLPPPRAYIQHTSSQGCGVWNVGRGEAFLLGPIIPTHLSSPLFSYRHHRHHHQHHLSLSLSLSSYHHPELHQVRLERRAGGDVRERRCAVVLGLDPFCRLAHVQEARRDAVIDERRNEPGLCRHHAQRKANAAAQQRYRSGTEAGVPISYGTDVCICSTRRSAPIPTIYIAPYTYPYVVLPVLSLLPATSTLYPSPSKHPSPSPPLSLPLSFLLLTCSSGGCARLSNWRAARGPGWRRR